MLVLLIETEHGNAEVPLRDGQTLVGREQDCNLCVDDELMSRHHARFRLDRDVFCVEDLASTNGVYVNGERISGRVQLQVGDLVLIGASKLRVDWKKSAEPSPSLPVPEPRPAEPEHAGVRVTARPPPLRSEADATGIARQEQILDLLAGMAAKVLSQGRVEQAEQLLSAPLQQFLADAKRRRTLPGDEAERVSGHAIRLAEATGRGVWLSFVVELYAVEPRPMPAAVIDGLLHAVRKVSRVDVKLLRGYLDALRSKAGGLSAGDRFLLQRLETFERVAAAR